MDSLPHSLPSSKYFSTTSRSSVSPQACTEEYDETGTSVSALTNVRAESAYSQASRPGTRQSTTSGRKSRNTYTSSILGTKETQSIICAVAEGRGIAPSVGLAFINISLGEITLTQICDNQSYLKTIHELQIMSPVRIVFQAQACPPNKFSTFFSLVEELVPGTQTVPFDRSHWSETAGITFIQDYAFQNDIEPIKVAMQGKFYATSSLAAAVQYVEHVFAIDFVPHSMRIRYKPSEDTLMIDISALQSLEIMHNQRSPKSKDSLFGLLNHTITPMGARLLQRNILQPPTKDDLIIPRHDALHELTIEEEMFHGIRKALKPFFDAERLLTKMIIVPSTNNISMVETALNQVLMLKSFLEAIPEVHRALRPAKSILLVKARNICDPDISLSVLGKICRVIEADVTFARSPLDLRNQRSFAVKAGINAMLDVTRQAYKELTEEVHQHLKDLERDHNITATLKYDNARKYWLRIKHSDLEDDCPPEVLVNVIHKKSHMECQTLDLIKLNLRLSDSSDEIVYRSDRQVQELMNELRQDISHLFHMCEAVALVDMVSAFANLATISDYIRPEFTGTLALDAARHPILSKARSLEYVPNEYYSTDRYCFHIVTGCNMSGKSTYIRAVALLQIMAQIGSFVPAKFASFSIIHSIFARVSLNDSIESNLSSFSLEMREMAFILRNVQSTSLVIVDELGRGTSTADGMAIAMAMSEALIQTKASIWFATHFIELARILADRPGVLNLHLASRSTITEAGVYHITMLYEATSGAIDEVGHYGIDLARAMGFPLSFIHKAEQIADDIRTKREANRQSSESQRTMLWRKLVLNLHGDLKQAQRSGNQETLPAYLLQLQQDFITRMEALKEH